MQKLINFGFDINNALQQGNMFLIGNGHIGYRGTLEEFGKDLNVSYNVIGLYDQFENKWRESVNMPNPLHIIVSGHSILKRKPKFHQITLDINRGIFKRKTIYSSLEISSERFIDSNDLLNSTYKIKALKDIKTKIKFGIDLDIYDINGPHFKEKHLIRNDHDLCFYGLTNENKKICEYVKYQFKSNYRYRNGYYYVDLSLKRGETFTLNIYSHIYEEKGYFVANYFENKKNHIACFKKHWQESRVLIGAKKDVQFLIDYSIYHLLILGSNKYCHSIPARGLSGQTYKGAIFWDTEIFLLPFFTLTNPNVARNLIKYRINTLSGALTKAKEFGYSGAFYAWESQDTGLEACSKYNITDALTGEPIRTYFNEKQIHISFDIAYAILKYMNVSGDYSILEEGARDVLDNIALFALSYAKKESDGLYHFNDVIGPDEYHERINDNAFTNYMAYYAIKESMPYLSNSVKIEVSNFFEKIYLNEINNGLIEQFKGYNRLEDATIDTVRSRLKVQNEYWGFQASKTKVIKQADVLTLLVLHQDKFNDLVLERNYQYYEKYTEHGSSLSASMYSIAASRIGNIDDAYKMFIKSASIDLGTNQKMFAGGIYIGGTHPASNAGAYLSLIFGFAGLNFKDGKILVEPHLPKEIKDIKFKIVFKNKKYQINVSNQETKIEEVSE